MNKRLSPKELKEKIVDFLKEHKNEKTKLHVIKIIPTEIVYLDSLKDGDRTKQILKQDQVLIKEDRIPVLL